MSDPSTVIIAGDWHGRTTWALSQLALMRHLVPNEDPLIVLHCGDYGFWPGSSFAEDTAAVAAELGMRIWVVPGNHEDYAGPRGVKRYISSRPLQSSQPLLALARGTSWEWHGLRWTAIGGATSPDRFWRIKDVSWWQDEELTPRQVTQITGNPVLRGAGGMLLTHDVGNRVPLRLEPWPSHWPKSEEVRAADHRHRVQQVANHIQPTAWVHGHYHQHYELDIDMGWGPVHVTGLNMDGERGNWGALNAKTLSWEVLSR